MVLSILTALSDSMYQRTSRTFLRRRRTRSGTLSNELASDRVQALVGTRDRHPPLPGMPGRYVEATAFCTFRSGARVVLEARKIGRAQVWPGTLRSSHTLASRILRTWWGAHSGLDVYDIPHRDMKRLQASWTCILRTDQQLSARTISSASTSLRSALSRLSRHYRASFAISIHTSLMFMYVEVAAGAHEIYFTPSLTRCTGDHTSRLSFTTQPAMTSDVARPSTCLGIHNPRQRPLRSSANIPVTDVASYVLGTATSAYFPPGRTEAHCMAA